MNNPVDQPKVSELDADEMSLIDAQPPQPILCRLNEYVEARLAVRNSRKQTYLAAEERVRAAYAALRDEFAAIPQPLIGIPGAEKLVGWINGEREILCAWLSSYIIDLKQDHVRNVDVILRLERLNSLLSSGAEKGEAVAYALPSELGWLADPDHLGEPRLRGFKFEASNGEKSIALFRAPPAPTSERVQALPAGFGRIDVTTANQIINDTLEAAAARVDAFVIEEQPGDVKTVLARKMAAAIRALNHKSS